MASNLAHLANVPNTSTAFKEVVALEQLKFSYTGPVAGFPLPILHIENLQVCKGERLFIYGPSGCGKTTLLGLLTGVLEAESGVVKVLGKNVTEMSRAAKDAFRAAHIGYIFQMFNLLPYLSVLDNILMPIVINKQRRMRLSKPPKEEAVTLAESLGLKHQLNAKSRALSVGQQQRVAAARALIGAPELVIADEPTSSLDADNRNEFLELLFEQCEAVSATLIFVSHDRSLQKMFDRSLDLSEINQAVSS